MGGGGGGGEGGRSLQITIIGNICGDPCDWLANKAGKILIGVGNAKDIHHTAGDTSLDNIFC